MAETLLVLGQVDVNATTLTTIYTVPGATQAAISTVVVCNRGAVATTFRLSIRVAGAADDPKQYLFYDVALPAQDTFACTFGMTLGAGDILSGYAGVTDVTFTAFGTQIS